MFDCAPIHANWTGHFMQALIYFFVAINFISISFDLLLVIIIIGVDVGYMLWCYLAVCFSYFPRFCVNFFFIFLLFISQTIMMWSVCFCAVLGTAQWISVSNIFLMAIFVQSERKTNLNYNKKRKTQMIFLALTLKTVAVLMSIHYDPASR